MLAPQGVASRLDLLSHVVGHETESLRDGSSTRDNSSSFGFPRLSILSK